MKQDIQDSAGLIARQSMWRFLRVQKSLDNMLVQVTHLLQMDTPSNICDCDGEW